MEVEEHPGIRKDLKKLKRYPTAEESLRSWARLFCVKGLAETPGIEQFNEFGNERVYKARVIPLKENVGKSQGYRLAFQVKSAHSIKLLVFSRHGIYTHEREMIAWVKERLLS